MWWTLVAGWLAGLVLGYLGAGGTVVGLPVLLYLSKLSPHESLGTNALGVFFIALALLTWRLLKCQIPTKVGLAFAIPGVIGNFIGVRLGLLYPGQKLVFLLGILLFGAAGWMLFLSTSREKKPQTGNTPQPPVLHRQALSPRRLILLIPTAFLVGAVSGFFAIGGGFMIVPTIALTGGLEIPDAAAAALLPITVFAGWIGLQYFSAHSARLIWALVMLTPGVAGGLLGVRIGHRLSKKTTQRIFAIFLVILGSYMAFK